MTDSPKDIQDELPQETTRANDSGSTTSSSARIKRMRGWLGVKSTSSLGGYDDGGGGVVYGDGHSGWNR
jgi:hypothetical protein